MTRKIEAAALVLFAALLTGIPSMLSAQTEPPLAPLNQPVRGELTDRDPVLSEDGAFKLYRFTAQAGRAYDIQLRSDDFSPALTVARPVGGVTDYIVRSTDHGLGAGALIRFEAPAAGSYLVLARTAGEELGSFTLTVSPAADSDGQPLVLGQAVNNWVESEAFHPLPSGNGSEIEITVRSRDFDTLLEVGRMVNGAFVQEQSDDDSGGDTDSRLYFTPGRSSDYVARVGPYGDSEGGSYAIVALEAPEMPEARTLPVGSSVRGELVENGTSVADGSPFSDWLLQARRGDRFSIDVTSGAFDTNVAVGTLEGRAFTEIASNDDAGTADLGSSDSRLVFSAPSDGPLTVRVTPFGGDGTGAYTIRVTELPSLPTTPLGGAIERGVKIEGELGNADAVLEDNAPYQEWRFSAAAGEQLEVLVTSEDFDTHLFVGRVVGGEFEEIASNDDWEDADNGTDSRVEFEAPADGEYIIRVRPFSADGAGNYALTLESMAGGTTATVTSGRIGQGETVSGSLTDSDARLDDGSPYEIWIFDAPAAGRFYVELMSSDFDAYLTVGRMVNGKFEAIAENDDYATGTNSRVELDVTEAGEYVVRANVLLAEERGNYTLRITPAAPDAVRI